MDEISIVIPTFNSKGFIGPCLDSVFSQSWQDFEVIVVDNGSRDGTPDLIRTNYPQVNLIENRQNLGACRARNQGIEASCGKWILTLDSDVVLAKDFLLVALKTINNGLPANVGIIQAKILKLNKETIYSCGIYLSRLRRFFDIGSGQKDKGQFNQSKHIFGACSACALYNRKMLQELKEETGYFDERFLFLVEDVDLAWRAQKKGWRSIFCPDGACYHYGNSSAISNQIKQYLCFRNRYYSIIKNEGLKNYYKKIFPLLFYDIPRLFYLFLSNRYIWK